MKKSRLAPPAFRPLYEQIKVLLTNSLAAGEWKPGEAIPSEQELAARFPGMTLAELEEFHGSVYSFYETVFGIAMIRAKERLHAVAADGVAATHLKVAKGTPLLCVDRVAYTYGEQPVEFRRGLCRTDGFSYVNELN